VDFDQGRSISFPSQPFTGSYKFMTCQITFFLSFLSQIESRSKTYWIFIDDKDVRE
jgi:hypothetical protein